MIPTMEHYLGKSPRYPHEVAVHQDDYKLDTYWAIARRLDFTQDATEELYDVVNYEGGLVGGYKVLPADITRARAFELYPVEAAALAWMHERIWKLHVPTTNADMHRKLFELRKARDPGPWPKHKYDTDIRVHVVRNRPEQGPESVRTYDGRIKFWIQSRHDVYAWDECPKYEMVGDDGRTYVEYETDITPIEVGSAELPRGRRRVDPDQITLW